MDEFSIIRKYFASQSVCREDVIVGIGDDAAVLTPPRGRNLVCTTDMLLDGVHFPESTDPFAVGYKALAVNLSDIAAMGAEPAWATLTLALPAVDEAWIAGFCAGFGELAGAHGVQLVGGDLVRGPLAIGVHVTGFADPSDRLLRSGARVGDGVFISGTLGDAGMGLRVVRGEVVLDPTEEQLALRKLRFPEPRVDLGRSLVKFGNSAIDISDGLVSDAGHIARASGVAIHLDIDRIPVGRSVVRGDTPDWAVVLGAGDDYELCFTVARDNWPRVAEVERRHGVPIAQVGSVQAGEGVHLFHRGLAYSPTESGYDHFR